MKSLSGARLSYIASDRTDADFCRLVRKDGTTLGFSSHVEDLTINSVLYKSGAGYTPSAYGGNIQLNPSVVDVEGILSTLGIPRADISAGLYDHAEVYVFTTNYLSPVVDEQKLFRGRWGQCRLERGKFITEFIGLSDAFNATVGRTYQAACDAELGDARCKVQISPSDWEASTAYTARLTADAGVGDVVSPTTENGYFYQCSTAGTSDSSEPTWSTTIDGTTNDGTAVWTTIRAYTLTGSVTSVTDRSEFTDSTKTQPNDWWTHGKVTFTSGSNNGLSFDIKKSTVSGVITLYDDTPYDIATSETYTIQAGCLKRLTEDCIGKFDNRLNNRGFKRIPTIKEVGKFGGQ